MLGLWVALLAALLVLVATWVAGEITERQERDLVDGRLAADLRLGRAEFADALRNAQLRAERLAGSERVQRTLADRDRTEAGRLAAEQDSIGLVAGGQLLAGSNTWVASRAVDVVGDEGRVLGQVVAGVTLDEELADDLARAAGVPPGDVVALAEGERLLAASAALAPGTTVPPGREGETEQEDATYRFLATPLLGGTDVRLLALADEEPIAAAVSDSRRRAFLAALATVLLAALVAWTAARLLGRRRGEPQAAAVAAAEPDARQRRARDVRPSEADASRVREAVALVGEALAATHDPEALLPVILQSAIGATGAVGARLVSGGNEVVRSGQPEVGGRPLALRLGSDHESVGQLLLYPAEGSSFDRDAEQLAHWLAAQATVALENERLHRTVKRQAITDELTQLANRRRFTETLAVEVRRAERFGDPVSLVLADLDDFKGINDRYGHQAGDEVLRRFADVLRENVRDFDLPVRYGGEEFAVLLPETGLDGGEQLARRLQTALLRLRLPAIGRDRAPVTASFGVAAFPPAGSAEALLSAADGALYRAKAAGKNRVVCAADDGSRTA